MCRVIEKYALALRKLLEKAAGNDYLLNNLLSSFSCERDRDIQLFLQKRAVEFEKLSKSRTYLIVDREQYRNTIIDKITIYGYISLSLKIFTAPEDTSNRQRRLLDGFSAKEHGKPISNFPCYLIGQLARNSNVPKDSITGTELLHFAYDIIAVSVDAVGGRNILVECRDTQKLVQFYTSNDFIPVSYIPYEDQNMVQLIRRI